tara:strand:+ start:743 stop:1063 length:321 start_codon:yes stop_codon:yes gene_type:complete
MNTFFSSEGLDVDLMQGMQPVSTKVEVKFGSLVGELLYISTGSFTSLQFFCSATSDVFLQENKSVNNFQLVFKDKIYDYSLQQYNYTLTPSVAGITISVEELQDGS